MNEFEFLEIGGPVSKEDAHKPVGNRIWPKGRHEPNQRRKAIGRKSQKWIWKYPKPLKNSRQKKRRGKKWMNLRIGFYECKIDDVFEGNKASEIGYVILHRNCQ